MDRIINIKVGGNYLSKDNKNAGARGEANVTKLRITFDDGWADYKNKKITFWDARGLNPVSISLLPTLAENESTYIVPIPAEPMAEVGMFEFVIEGTVDDKVQRSFSDKLEVKDSPSTEGAGQPVPPTEDELTQLEGALNEIKNDILTVRNAKEDAKASAESAEEDAKTAESAMNSAKESADKAHNALGKTSYIGANGNWFAWDSETDAFYDTMIKAQAGSTVYVGENPPDDADVWVYPDGGYSDPTTKLKQLCYYGDMNIVPSPEELFTFELFQDEDGNFKEYDYYYYRISANPDATLTGDIVIPYEHNGLPVGGIDSFASTKIQKVVLPKTIINIYGPAFSGCTELTEITMNSFIYMPDETFRDCTSLKSITIPEGTAAMYGMLQGCTSLKSITIPNSLIRIWKNTFSGCTSLTDVYYEGSKAEWDKIEISDGNECLLNATIHYGYSEAAEGGSECNIDSEISDASENAVQNKVVKAYVDDTIKTAIGDIDKALGNIIAKYGLEGVE